jgi:SAM-dependent methyltransferase
MTFDVAAEAYDRFMGEWARALAPRFADFASVRPGMRVVDVGCGPGGLTAVLVERVGSERVTAVDPSEPFVLAARERLPGVDVRRAAAEALPFPDGLFDAALAQLVVHFMTDAVAGLREMARVVRPGGAVAACVWDFGGDRGPLGPFWEAVRALDPGAGDESHLAGARRGHLAELFDAAGIEAIEETELQVTRDYAGFDDWWAPFTGGVGPGGAYVGGLDAAGQAALRDRCRSMLPDGPFTLPGVAWAARGARPADLSRADD